MKRQELYPETTKFLIYILDDKDRATFREVSSLSTEFQKDLIAIIAEDIFHFDGIKQEKLSAIEKLVEKKAFPGEFKPQFKAFVRICNRTVYPSWNGMIYEKDIKKFRETLFSNDRIYLLDVNIML